MQEQAPGFTYDVQPVGRKRLAARNSDANGRDCADSVCENAVSVCECRSKRTAPTMCSPAAGSVWSSGIRMPTVEFALILCVKAEARTRHPRSPSEVQ